MKAVSSQAREFVARSEVLPIFVRDGFTPYIPAWDEGIDFIVYREEDDLLIKIQLKSRWSIDRKYIGRHIGILFADGKNEKDWYLCPHDDMVRYAGENTTYLQSGSWNSKVYTASGNPKMGLYNVSKMNRAMELHFQQFKLSKLESNNEIFEKFRVKP